MTIYAGAEWLSDNFSEKRPAEKLGRQDAC
jgi:hypothetical protein